MARAYCAQCGAEVPVEGGVCFFGHPVGAAEEPAAPEPEPEPEPAPEPVADAPREDAVDVSALEAAIAELEHRDDDSWEAEPAAPSEPTAESEPLVGPEPATEPEAATVPEPDAFATDDTEKEPFVPDDTAPDAFTTDDPERDAFATDDAGSDASGPAATPEDAFAPSPDEDYSLAWEMEIDGPDVAAGTEPESLEDVDGDLDVAGDAEEPAPAHEPAEAADEGEPVALRPDMEAAAAAAAEAAREHEGDDDTTTPDGEPLPTEPAATGPTDAPAAHVSSADDSEFVWEQEITADEEAGATSATSAPWAEPVSEPSAEQSEEDAAESEQPAAQASDGWDLTDWNLDAALDDSASAGEPDASAGLADAAAAEPDLAPTRDVEPDDDEDEPGEPEPAEDVAEESEEREPDRRGGPDIDPAHFTARDRSRGGLFRRSRGR